MKQQEIKIDIDEKRCKGCGYCVLVCPKGIIQLCDSINLDGYRFSMLTDARKCTGCRFCAIICPEIAIEIETVNRSDKAGLER